MSISSLINPATPNNISNKINETIAAINSGTVDGQRYQTVLEWCEVTGANGEAAETTNVASSRLLVVDTSYYFCKNGESLGELTVQAFDSNGCTTLGQILSQMFGTTLTVTSGTYLTDATNIFNLFATDSSHESKTVYSTITTTELGNIIIYYDASATAVISAKMCLELKQIVSTLTVAPYYKELWSGNVVVNADPIEYITVANSDFNKYKTFLFLAGTPSLGSILYGHGTLAQGHFYIFFYGSVYLTGELYGSTDIYITYENGASEGFYITKLWGLTE